MVAFFKNPNYSALNSTPQFEQLEALLHFVPLTAGTTHFKDSKAAVYIFIQAGTVTQNNSNTQLHVGDVALLNPSQTITAVTNAQIWCIKASEVQINGLQHFLDAILQKSFGNKAVA
jgi:hypothetical protein